jgi:hypothetical protein
MQKGWKLEGDATGLKLKKNGNIIKFNIKIPTPMGVVYAIRIKRREEMVMTGSDSRNEPKKINLSKAHQKLGHISIAETKRIGKSLNWNIVNDIKKCESCTFGKAKQESVIKKSNHETAEEAEQTIFLDISSVKN